LVRGSDSSTIERRIGCEGVWSLGVGRQLSAVEGILREEAI